MKILKLFFTLNLTVAVGVMIMLKKNKYCCKCRQRLVKKYVRTAVVIERLKVSTAAMWSTSASVGMSE